jgi:hypothetical protein
MWSSPARKVRLVASHAESRKDPVRSARSKK